MRPDLTDITLVVDRSGSMEEVRSDAEGGVNAFIAEQAKQPGEALFTLVQFDTVYEFVHKGVPISQVPRYELVPRGMTALLDAVGRAINETAERLSKLNEEERPGLVVFVIMTDGYENSSCEFSKDTIKEMVERQQKEANWQFTFLGANQDAFAEGTGMGVDADGVANYTAAKSDKAYAAVQAKVSRMRTQRRTGKKISNKFTDQEREDMA